MKNDRWQMRKEAIKLMNTYPEKSMKLLEESQKMYIEELKKNQYPDWFKNRDKIKF